MTNRLDGGPRDVAAIEQYDVRKLLERTSMAAPPVPSNEALASATHAP